MSLFAKISPKKKWPCNGRTIEVYRDPNDAIPLYVTPWSLAAKASLDAIEQAKGEVGLEYQQEILGLSELVNSESEEVLIEFKMIYAYYADSPCDREEDYRLQLFKLLDEKRKFRYIRLQMNTLIILVRNNVQPEKIMAEFETISRTITRSIDEIEMSEEFRKVGKLTDRWRNDDDDD